MASGMRMLIAVLVGTVLLSAATYPERTEPPTVLADTMTISEVRRGAQIGAVPGLDEALIVERPVGATADASSSVFLVDGDGVRRVAVTYGRASPSLIEVVNGLSPRDRIVVSDMSAWDAFDRLRLRWR